MSDPYTEDSRTSSAGRRDHRAMPRARARTEIPGETTRTFLSPPMRQVHALLGGWMRTAGMQVRVDAAGNLRGALPAAEADAPRLLIGSHLDTVANAGAFDGMLGVVIGVAFVEANGGQRRAQDFPSRSKSSASPKKRGCGSPSRSSGSLALVGELDAATLARKDRDGVSVADAIHAFGLDPAELPAAVVDETAFGYLEFHIEQGPVLESEDLPLGIVEAIVGQTRMELVFSGQANHAGTTPMGRLRHDALAAAAQWIVEVERYANCEGLVATVGKVESSPGAGNVIAGRFTATLDVRHAHDEVRKAAVRHYVEYAEATGAARG